MASLRSCARRIREDAACGIPWIVLWKEGRSWRAETICPDDFILDVQMDLFDYDMVTVREAVAADPNAILVNGYYHNIACCEDGSLPELQDLVDALRWQYEDCHPLVTDWTLREVP